MSGRKEILEQVIRLHDPLSSLTKRLNKFGWDSKDALVTLQPGDIISILERYLNNQVTTEDIEAWANALEGRDDVNYESGQEKIILAVINELANPLLTRTLTRKTAYDLIHRLSSK